MKKLLLAIIFVIPGCLIFAETEDTIKYYKDIPRGFHFKNAAIDLQCARFEPVASPCYLKKINVTLGGGTGTFRLRLFGYEAGDQIPDLMNDKIAPIKVTKSNSLISTVTVELPEPVMFDNSWFWVAIDSLSNGVVLLTDTFTLKIPYDTYYYQAIHSNDNTVWSISPYSYFISAIVTYPTKSSPAYLREVTEESGITAELPNSCIAAADYDLDGWIDLLINNKLYHNEQNGTFRDVTQSLGVVNRHNPCDTSISGRCYSFVDSDNDGDLDIFIFARDTSVVFINNNGQYTEKILSLPQFLTFGYSPLLFNWADLNSDGYPDLYAGQQASGYYADGPDILPSFIFINNKENDFTDESTRMFSKFHVFRRARASQFGDFNNDGYQDLYIGNYFLNRDELYYNDGTGNFDDIAPYKGLDLTNTGSMHGCGVNLFDYDNDGDLDIIVARIAHSRFVREYDHRGTVLYRNEGPPDFNFTDLTGQYNDYPGQIAPCGLEYEDYHSSAAFADVNNDGLPDLLLKTYNPYRFISFYEQQPDHSFTMKRFEYGLDRLDARNAGQVWLDYNNDGKLDLIITNNDKMSLFKNTISNGMNKVELDLKCTSGNKFAIGARACVHSGDSTFMREVVCGQDEWVQFPYRLHIGMGRLQTIDSVVVLWPVKPQKRDVYKNLEPNRIYTLNEGGAVSSQVLGVPYPVMAVSQSVAYPNPFNRSTTISYIVPEFGKVELKVFDARGNEIAVLVDALMEPGDYEAVFSGEGLAPGSYYYTLKTGSKSQSSKIILVR